MSDQDALLGSGESPAPAEPQPPSPASPNREDLLGLRIAAALIDLAPRADGLPGSLPQIVRVIEQL
jgi:hypothetical protein